MTTTINFKIEEDDKISLQEISNDKECTISELMREIVIDYIDNYYPDELDDFEEGYFSRTREKTIIYLKRPHNTLNDLDND